MLSFLFLLTDFSLIGARQAGVGISGKADITSGHWFELSSDSWSLFPALVLMGTCFWPNSLNS